MPQLITHAGAVELAILILVGSFVYNHTLCMQAVKELESLCVSSYSLLDWIGKALGFMKIILCRIPPERGSKPYLSNGLKGEQ